MTINREATIRWKGYDPNDLKPYSNKRVWTNCNDCGNGRWSTKDQCDKLCKKCVSIIRESPPKPKFVLEEDRFISGTGIDRIETIRIMGYDPADLSFGSGRKVWWTCENCGMSKWKKMQDYSNLCQTCANRADDKRMKQSKVISEIMLNSNTSKKWAEKQREGMDIVQHHYIYDESDRKKYTVGITRSDHTRLHKLFQKLRYIVPHIKGE